MQVGLRSLPTYPPSIRSTPTSPHRALAPILREFDITRRAVRGRMPIVLASFALFTAVGLTRADAPSFWTVAQALTIAALYAIPFLALFSLADQLETIAEDRLKNPERPLAAGLIDRRGALVRCAAWATVLFALAGAAGVLEWAALWTAATIYHGFSGGRRHWFIENVAVFGCGCFALLAASWEIGYGEMTADALRWILGTAIWCGLIVVVRDFRDVQGDLREGRRTLPIQLGSHRAREVAVGGIVLLANAAALALTTLCHAPVAVLYTFVVIALHLLIALRLLVFRTPEDDAKTYRFVALAYCVVLTGGFIFL